MVMDYVNGRFVETADRADITDPDEMKRLLNQVAGCPEGFNDVPPIVSVRNDGSSFTAPTGT